MNDAGYQNIVYECMACVAYIGGPLLGIAMLLGLVLGILQAAMQLQEQTFPQIAKMLALGAALYLFGAAMAQPLVGFSERMFSFATVNR